MIDSIHDDELGSMRELLSSKPAPSRQPGANSAGTGVRRQAANPTPGLSNPLRSPAMSSAQRVEASLSYMMQHLDQPMNVTALCAMTGLSESRYFEVFKRVTGRTPVNYLIHARMSRAAELLVGSLLQIKEVAVQVGYDDQFYFSRLFKSVHGSCPSEFRARNELLGSAQQNA